METDEVNYTFPQGTNCDNIKNDDNVTIIKHDPNLQTRKIVAESIDSTERIEDATPEYKEIGQFLYMDVGRWGGDIETGDEWTRRRNFGLVCGSAAILCNYKNPNMSVDHYLGLIDEEVLDCPDIKKMMPLLNKLSGSKILGPVTVVKALVCTDKTAETPHSDEILVFLGDIHAPVMNVNDRTYLQNTESIDEEWARSCGRIEITGKAIAENKKIVKKVTTFFDGINALGPEPERTKIIALSKDISGKSFESQQLDSLDNNKTTIKSDEWIIIGLKMILEELLKDQVFDGSDDNETITGDSACRWFKHYHGDGERKGVDIFLNAGEDLLKFLNLLLDYQNYNQM